MNEQIAQDVLGKLAAVAEVMLDIPLARSSKEFTKVGQALQLIQLAADQVRMSVKKEEPPKA